MAGGAGEGEGEDLNYTLIFPKHILTNRQFRAIIYCNKEKAVTRSGKSVGLQRVTGWCKVIAEILSKSPLSFPSKGFRDPVERNVSSRYRGAYCLIRMRGYCRKAVPSKSGTVEVNGFHLFGGEGYFCV